MLQPHLLQLDYQLLTLLPQLAISQLLEFLFELRIACLRVKVVIDYERAAYELRKDKIFDCFCGFYPEAKL